MINSPGISSINFVPTSESFSLSVTDSTGATKVLKGIQSIVQNNTDIVITDSSGVVHTISPRVSIEPFLTQGIYLGQGNPLTPNKGQYKAGNTTWDVSMGQSMLENGNISGFTNSTQNQLDNPNSYISLESSSRNFCFAHRFSTNSPQGRTFLKVNIRFNHADVKYGIFYKVGNKLCRTYNEVSHMNANITEDIYYDITGVTGDVVVYVWASRWFSPIGVVQLIGQNQNIRVLKGTWQQFNLIKDGLAEMSQYFITDTNRGNGVLVTKIGTNWKDAFGRNVDRSYTS